MEKLNLNIPEAEVFYDKDRNYIKISFTDKANKVTPEEGFTITKKIFEHILELKPKFILIDHERLTFPYTSEFREKTTQEIVPMVIQTGTVEKIAYIMSKDIITKIGLQLMQEDLIKKDSGIERAFFQSVEEGEKWLFSK